MCQYDNVPMHSCVNMTMYQLPPGGITHTDSHMHIGASAYCFIQFERCKDTPKFRTFAT